MVGAFVQTGVAIRSHSRSFVASYSLLNRR